MGPAPVATVRGQMNAAGQEPITMLREIGASAPGRDAGRPSASAARDRYDGAFAAIASTSTRKSGEASASMTSNVDGG